MRVSPIQKQPKPIDVTWIVRGFKALLVMGVLYLGWQAFQWSSQTLHYAEAARTICHKQRINVDYLKFCNPKVDGPACTLESMSRVNRHLASIDLECAPLQEQTVFVVEQWAEPVKDDLLASVD